MIYVFSYSRLKHTYTYLCAQCKYTSYDITKIVQTLPSINIDHLLLQQDVDAVLNKLIIRGHYLFLVKKNWEGRISASLSVDYV